MARLTGASNQALYLAPSKMMQVGLVLLAVAGVRREMLMKALGCSPKNKNVFLAVIQANWSLPPEGDRARKRAQSRLSEYARALEGARLKDVSPDNLPEALAEGGGVEAFANYAREQKASETPTVRASGAAFGGRATSRQPVSRREPRSRSHDATGRTRDRQAANVRNRDVHAEAVNVAREPEDTEEDVDTGTDRRAPLHMEPEVAERLKLQDGEVVAIIDVDRDVSPPRLELVGFQNLPRNGLKDPEKLLDRMIGSIAS